MKKYSLKFLFVAFLGIHIPLIGMLVYFIFNNSTAYDPYLVLTLVLIFTLSATALTLLILNNLLRLIILAKDFLSNYIINKELPSLPTNYEDEIGILMKEIQFSIKTLDELIKEKQDLVGLMSHDLKNPLSSMINYAELIKTDPKFGKIGDKILEASIVQRDIINSVLAMLEQEEIIITDSMKEEIVLVDLVGSIIKL